MNQISHSHYLLNTDFKKRREGEKKKGPPIQASSAYTRTLTQETSLRSGKCDVFSAMVFTNKAANQNHFKSLAINDHNDHSNCLQQAFKATLREKCVSVIFSTSQKDRMSDLSHCQCLRKLSLIEAIELKNSLATFNNYKYKKIQGLVAKYAAKPQGTNCSYFFPYKWTVRNKDMATDTNGSDFSLHGQTAEMKMSL